MIRRVSYLVVAFLERGTRPDILREEVGNEQVERLVRALERREVAEARQGEADPFAIRVAPRRTIAHLGQLPRQRTLVRSGSCSRVIQQCGRKGRPEEPL